jgi:hypothetical protein
VRHLFNFLTCWKFHPAVNKDGDLLEIHVPARFQNGPHRGIALWLILCCGVHVMNELKVLFMFSGTCARFARCSPIHHGIQSKSNDGNGKMKSPG